MSSAPEDKVDPKLLEILVCPLTKTVLEYDASAHELISAAPPASPSPSSTGYRACGSRTRAASMKARAGASRHG